MNKTAEERITQSRVRLLLTKPFFGTLATRLRLVDVTNDGIDTAGTDGRNLYFNRNFVDSLDDKELDFLIGHEVLHCVYDHMEACGERDKQVYNMAADYNINMTLVEQNIGSPINSSKLGGGEACLDWKYSGKNSYEIYDELIQDPNLQPRHMDVHIVIGGGPDSDSDNAATRPGKALTPEEQKQLSDEIKQAILNAAQSAGQDVPADVRRLVNELVNPKMDWKELLRTHLESSLKSDFTFMTPSKRSGAVIFPGMKKDEELDICVAIDTSGSIDNKMLTDFVSEIQGIIDQFNSYKINIMQFDTAVYGVDEFTADDGRDLTEYEIVGGGGTDFDVVFKYMEENDINPDQLIMFTDGMPWDSWGNPDYCDTMFVVHSDKSKTIESPFGVTVHYD
jgi:predicted metal-dependent peptidase